MREQNMEDFEDKLDQQFVDGLNQGYTEGYSACIDDLKSNLFYSAKQLFESLNRINKLENQKFQQKGD